MLTRMSTLVLILAFLSGCSSSQTKPASSETPQASGGASAEAAAQAPKASSTPATSNTAPSGTPPKPPVSCKKGSDERLIEVAENDGGCFLFYTKYKVKKRVAWSQFGNSHCESVRDQIRGNLEEAGYKCQWQE